MQLSVMRTRLRRRIGNPDTIDVSDSILTEHINSAYRDIGARFRFHKIRKLCTFPTTSGVSRYGIPSDCEQVLRLRDATSGWKIRKADDRDEALQEALENEISGKPTSYIRQRDWVRLDPTPDGAYVIEMFYLASIIELSADADVPVIPASWHEGIVKLARHYFYDDSGDVPKSQYALSIYNSWLTTKPNEIDEEKRDLDKGVRLPTLDSGRSGFSQDDFDRGGSGWRY